MKVSDEQKQEKQCDKVTIKPLTMTELPSQDLVTADDDRGTEDNTTYAEAVKYWTTVHKRVKTVSTKTLQEGSAVIRSATNVMIRAAKLSDLRWANVFASRLDPTVIYLYLIVLRMLLVLMK